MKKRKKYCKYCKKELSKIQKIKKNHFCSPKCNGLFRIDKKLSKKTKKRMSIATQGQHKGTLEEQYGKKRAKQIKKKRSQSKTKIKDIKTVHNTLINIFKYNRQMSKMDFLNSQITRNELGAIDTIRKTLRREGTTLDKIAFDIGFQFKSPNRFSPNIGKNEKQMLNDIEQKRGIIIERDFSVGGYYPDGYDKDNNIIYEVDEKHHKYQQPQDKFRENKIKNILGCRVVRIKDGW